jgi:hypothetical protein
MAATVEIRSYHGATPDSGTNVAGGNVRFKLADNDTVDAVDPIAIPGAGTVYSWAKNLKFYAATTPSNNLTNLKFYTDGSAGFGTGVGLVARTQQTFTGTFTSGNTTTGTDSGATFPTSNGGLTGFVLEITAGAQSGNSRRISSNTGTVITVASAFGGALDNTSVYRIWYIDPINNAATQLQSFGTGGDAFTFTSGSALAVNGSLANPTTGAFGGGVYLQMSVASTATQGTTSSETITFQYDES